MLEIIKKLDSGTVRGLIVATIPLLVLIASFFGIDEAVFQAQLEGWGEKLVALVSLLGIAWAAYARVFKPTPPLTEKALQETQRMVAAGKLQPVASQGKAGQGGFIRAGMLGLILAFSVALPAILTLQGCASLGLPVAQSFNERLASGYTTVTAVREATSAWVDGQVRAAQAEPDQAKRDALLKAVKADAQNIQAQADQAREGLDIARSLSDLNFEAAEERLVSTLRILEALQTYLEGRT